MPSAYSRLRVVTSALATAVAPIASTGSPLSHLSGAVAGNGSSLQSLSSFIIVNTTAAKNFASLDSPIQFASTQACACGRTISEIPLLPWIHTRSQWLSRSAAQIKRCEIVVKKIRSYK
jgi:hypothetical protein